MDLPYKTLKQLLAGKPLGAFAVTPTTTVLEALQAMADKGTGLVIVLDGDKLVGVFSERDYARKGELRGRTAKDTLIRDVMTGNVFYVTLANSVPQCMALMNEKNIRHLPVMEGEKVIGVLSSRDLVKEVVSHHVHLIHDLEVERLSILGSSGSTY